MTTHETTPGGIDDGGEKPKQNALARIESGQIRMTQETGLAKAAVEGVLKDAPGKKVKLTMGGEKAMSTVDEGVGETIDPLSVIDAVDHGQRRLDQSFIALGQIAQGMEGSRQAFAELLAKAKGTKVDPNAETFRALKLSIDPTRIVEAAHYFDQAIAALAANLDKTKTRFDVVKTLAELDWAPAVDSIVAPLKSNGLAKKNDKLIAELSKLGELVNKIFKDGFVQGKSAAVVQLTDEKDLQEAISLLYTEIQKQLREGTDLEDSEIGLSIISRLSGTLVKFVIEMREGVVALNSKAVYGAARRTLSEADMAVIKEKGLQGYSDQKKAGPWEDRPIELTTYTDKTFEKIAVNPANRTPEEWATMNDKTKKSIIAWTITNGSVKELFKVMTSDMVIRHTLDLKDAQGKPYDVVIHGLEKEEDSSVIVETNAPGLNKRLDMNEPRHQKDIETLMSLLTPGWRVLPADKPHQEAIEQK